jgi:hypothetical protein
MAVFPKTTKTVFTTARRTDTTLAIHTWRFITMLTTVFTAGWTSCVMVRIRTVGVDQKQAVDQRTATGHTENSDNKQTCGKVSHGFIIPSVFNNLALYEATHHGPHRAAKPFDVT